MTAVWGEALETPVDIYRAWRAHGEDEKIAFTVKRGGSEVKLSAVFANPEAPKADAPKTEAPKTEAPKTDDAPKAEAPKTGAPKAEAPRTGAPKSDEASEKRPAEAQESGAKSATSSRVW